ncbi:MAG: DUF1501 domain-containing protein [Roseibacillus sp.]|jgi:hypothetical protein|nr:DUF1501 domain-containing protein [Roseibacillus sp.]MDP7106701.1 DUF1501 domain-containing protein [Roseibacillus sp.]MDP7308501.1 DUF1501 domain-containing protein [Roseibacillus sp.]MDP7495719.1 DUF1501 domain-containing protein [Roseibacillus sp.]MDP7654755.1 DUF1501 domain-containing protein [Roseibacillus sp.]|tara:strand:- start:154 stop:1554 length:1401 start_codon:yes stop_codon:yes gene_type:complete
MSFLCQNRQVRPLTRREMLRTSSAGFGALALQGLLAQEAQAASALSPKPAPSPARARRIIFLFMHGGPSQVDLFDHKPQLTRDDNKPLPFEKPRIVSAKTGNLLASPWKFMKHGQSGAEVSEILPRLSAIVDDLCIVKSIYGSNSRHGGALLELHTGSDTFTRPAMGSWVNYGLGTENQNLPGFITIDPSGSHGGSNAWSSAFLPAHYQGTRIGGKGRGMTVPFIESPLKDRNLQRRELDLLRAMNRDHLATSAGDSELEARIASYELAFRMQMEAPGIQDISGEPESIRKLYGLDQDNTKKFGEKCLMARRFSEAGVRFVQVTHRYWDSHGNLRKDHARLAAEMDGPVAGLISDLKQRGLLDETLILWGGEFGRTPVAQGRDGRDHNPHANTMFLAGGGIKPGIQYGATDEYSYYARENRVHFHDLHATILHQLGIDHTKLTYRYGGRDFRLTNVQGRVVKGLLT